jgi:hypothetical protein
LYYLRELSGHGVAVIARLEDYRARADECEKQALAASDPKVKAQLQLLARQWRELADKAERVARS